MRPIGSRRTSRALVTATLGCALGVAGAVTYSSAQDMMGGGQMGESEKRAGTTPATQPAGGAGAEQEMMAAWMAAMTPGEHHKHLEQMVGKYKADVKFRMDPAAPEQSATGYSHNEMILGGRFLRQDYGGDFMGRPFKGLGLTGYDNLKQKHVGLWADEMSTSLMTAEGTCEAGGKTIVFKGEYDDPVSKRKMPFRQVVTVTGPDRHTFESYMPGPDGKEFRNMLITYTKEK